MERSWEVSVTREASGRVSVTIYGIDGDRQMSIVDEHEFGPFDTDVDIVRWVWRRLSLDTVRPSVV